jgi:uncharacterized damage-inducible protein DinB
MNPEQIRLLFAYDAWANHRILDACAALAPEQFTRDLGSSFPSVRDTAAHILGAYWVWLERFHGRSAQSLLKTEQFPDLASLRTRWSEVERELHSYANSLSAEDLDGEFEYRDLKGNQFRNPRWQALQQLVNHGSYHRGQITTMLRQLGAAPVSTDLIRFYRERQAQVAS